MKAYCPIDVIRCGSSTSVRAVQPKNAAPPIVERSSGKTISVSELHPENAYPPSLSTVVLPRSAFFSEAFLSTAKSLKVVRLSGKVIF